MDNRETVHHLAGRILKMLSDSDEAPTLQIAACRAAAEIIHQTNEAQGAVEMRAELMRKLRGY